MQSTSTLYQDIISGVHHKEVRLVIGEAGRLITKKGESITFGGVSILVGSTGADGGYDESVLVSLQTNSTIFSEERPIVGSCVSSELDVTMLKPFGVIPRQARLVPYVRVVNKVAASEWLQKGVYFVDTRESDIDNSEVEYISLHGYDCMLRAEQNYPASTLAWPARDIDVVYEIASFMDVPVDSRTLDIMTDGFLVQYPAEYSCREVLGYIAALYAGNFIMSDLGALRLVPLNSIPVETRYLVSSARQPITFGGVRILV